MQLLFGGAPEVSPACPPPIAKLPQELVEMVISYFIYNKCSLMACSMMCYPWYIAVELGSSTHLTVCALWLHHIVALLEGSQVDSHMIICHLSNVGMLLTYLYIYHIRCVNMI